MTNFPKEDENGSDEDNDALTLRDTSAGGSRTLSAVLDDQVAAEAVLGDDREDLASRPKHKNCSECEDIEAEVRCEGCGDLYCKICFDMLHRKGSRSKHSHVHLASGSLRSSGGSLRRSAGTPDRLPANYVSSIAAVAKLSAPSVSARVQDDGQDELASEESSEEDEYIPPNPNRAYHTSFNTNYYKNLEKERRKEEMRQMAEQAKSQASSEDVKRQAAYFAERVKYIPLRLTLKERKALRLLESALTVTEYTDKIDRTDWKTVAHRTRAQLQDICALMSGLVVSEDYGLGQKLLVDRNFRANADFFRSILEIGRRHKIMNPEKMRSEYGKLIYILMDAAQPKIQELFEFSLVKPVRTVYSLFEEAGILRILHDPHFYSSVMEIQPHGKSRHLIDREIAQKERSQNYLARQYSNPKISPEDIKQALYSVGDNHSYLAYNRDPIANMIALLERFFDPKLGPQEAKFSLGIVAGEDGARLTHSHDRQYTYVLQSLHLWCEITNDMFRLWYLGEQDLLDGANPYQLRDTGQGLHRVQQAPRVWKAMQGLLHTTQQRVGSWVGSAVVHLGDANVPNALMFIDKYTQISRILNPIVLTLKEIDQFMKTPGLAEYVTHGFGGPEAAQKLILADFFRHAFDGSGADNFFDAGSCIDGRLTSAWNWCSQIESKSYYPLFKLSGFLGFDGSEGFQR